MRQLSLGFLNQIPLADNAGSFSHGGVNSELFRLELETRYHSIMESTDIFSRKTVSFQANKVAILHNWFKYREGFSVELVETLLAEFNIKPAQTILDPFAGSGTTLLQAKLLGINAIGIELLPYCHWVYEAKARAYDYDIYEIVELRDRIASQSPPKSNVRFPHIAITETAFSEEIEEELMSYASWFPTLSISDNAKLLAGALLMSILEDISYTRKDGQYLRWDTRAGKIKERNVARSEDGLQAIRGIDKGRLPSVKEALLQKYNTVIRDLLTLQKEPPPVSCQTLIPGNTLLELPTMAENTVDAVITSPPYANRYDYTRTYALELAFLNIQEGIFELRQNMLSCTVENKTKTQQLELLYQSLGAGERFEAVAHIVQSSSVLQEIGAALETRLKRGEINNVGVLRMIRQYFSELALVYAELYRICQKGAYVAFVNDNVRYAGEVIPVDLISTSLAEAIGFTPLKVYVIPQKKGNSSQQMKKFGRRELRKSITIWQKR